MNKVNRVVLDNGLTLIHAQVDRAPVVSLIAWVKAGSAAEDETEYGIAHMCEHNVFKGTKRRGVGEICAEAENAGGDINAYTSYDETCFYLTLPVAQADLGMDLLADMLQNATIDPEELEREKEVILEEYRRGLDMPRQTIMRQIFEVSYQNHPYGHDIIGTEESIKAQTQASLLHFMAKHYIPENMLVTIVGQITLEEAKKLTKKYWGDWHPQVICQNHGPQNNNTTAAIEKTAISIIGKKQQQECHLALAWTIPSFDHEDIPALDLISTILGGSASSRLNTILRDQLNLVNGITSYSFTPISQGIFLIGTSLEGSKLLPTMKALVECLKDLMTREIFQEELDKAKFILQSDTWRKMETADGLAMDYANQEAIAGDPNYEFIYNALLDEVTPAKLRQVAAKYLQKPAALTILAPAEVPLPQKRRLAAVLTKLQLPHTRGTTTAWRDSHGWYLYNLPGGGTMVAQVDHSAPIVACSISYNGGQRYETKGESGIETFLAKMLSYSTKHHSHEEMMTMIDKLAAGVKATSGRNSINMLGSFLAKNFLDGLPLMLECLFEPAFKKNDVEAVRRLVLEQIRTKNDRPSTQAIETMLKGLYGEHPLGAPKTGIAEDVMAITTKSLKEHYQKYIRQNVPFITIVGDFDPETSSSIIISAFKKYGHKTAALPEIPAVTPLTASKNIHIAANKEQVHLSLGFLGPDMYQIKERWAMTLFCSAIGGMSGRLFTRLRDVESLCYTVSASYTPGPTSGYICFYIATAPDKAAQAKEGLIREIDKLLNEGLLDEELTKARNAMLGQDLIGQQYMENRASDMALDGLYKLPYDSYLNLANELQKITITDIQETAKKYLCWDRAVWADVGDAK